jgi:hypothetical protein
VNVRDIQFEAAGGKNVLTWGQRSMATILAEMGEDGHFFNFGGIVDVPAGRSTQAVVDAVRELVQRHAGLRTLFPDKLTQLVAEQGTIRLTTHEVAPADAAHTAAGLVQQLAGTAFRHDEDWPVRLALVQAGGVPQKLVIVVSHLVADGQSCRIVLDELRQLLAGVPLAPDDTTWSPLEVAAHEQSAAGQAEGEASVRHWCAEAREVPRTNFDFPKHDPDPIRFLGLRMSSTAVAVAATQIAREWRCSTSAVILAAISAVLSRYTGHRRIALLLLANNRWRPEVARTVMTANNGGMFSVEVDGDASFGELANLTWRRALRGYQSARYDPQVLEKAIWEVDLERGLHLYRNVAFNDTRVADGWTDLPELPQTEGAWSDLRASTTVDIFGQWESLLGRVCFSLHGLTSQAVLDVEIDTSFIPAATGRQLLVGIEALLVRAAQRSVLMHELGDVTGVEPVARDAGWRWLARAAGFVEVAQVGPIVAAATGAAACGVFVEPDDAGERLVAYLGPVDAGVPENLHEEVCSRIKGVFGYGAIAPHHYVFCAAAPPDGDQAGWRSQPVLFTSDGTVTGPRAGTDS